MVTASHLPSDRNGLKFFGPEGGLNGKQIDRLLELVSALAPVALALADRGHDGCGGGSDGADEALIGKGEEILDASTATREDDDVHLGVGL